MNKMSDILFFVNRKKSGYSFGGHPVLNQYGKDFSPNENLKPIWQT